MEYSKTEESRSLKNENDTGQLIFFYYAVISYRGLSWDFNKWFCWDTGLLYYLFVKYTLWYI